jgi:hypothetical protein
VADDRDSISGRDRDSPPRPHRLWCPPNHLPSGCRWRFARGEKRPVRQDDHKPTSNAEVKNTTPPYVFVLWCLVKQRIRLHGAVLS